MQLRKFLVGTALLVTAASCTLPAKADMKVTATMTIDNPQLQKMMDNLPPEQKGMMAKMGLSIGQPIITTSYFTDKKQRTDSLSISTLVDQSEKKITTLNSVSKTYSVMTFDPTKVPAPVEGTTSTVTATTETKTILGHLTHKFLMTMTLPKSPGASSMTGDIWVAQDIPMPTTAPPSGGGPMDQIQAQFKKLNGMPLEVTMTAAGGQVGNTTITYDVTAISNDPLPASTFDIPDGYKKSSVPGDFGATVRPGGPGN